MLCNCLSVCYSSLLSPLLTFRVQSFSFSISSCETRERLEVKACEQEDKQQFVCMPAAAGRLKPSLIFVSTSGGAKEGVFQLRPFPQPGGQPASQPPALWEAHVQQPHQRIPKEADQSRRGEASLLHCGRTKKGTSAQRPGWERKWFVFCSWSCCGCCLPSCPALPFPALPCPTQAGQNPNNLAQGLSLGLAPLQRLPH